MNGVYSLHFRSLKYTPTREVSIVPFLNGQHWVLVPRRNFTHSDEYEMWVEGPTKEKKVTLDRWVLSMEEIVKLTLPVLDVEVSRDNADVIVSWMPVPECQYQLHYRERGTQNWTWVNEEDIEPGSYEFLHLEAFTEYEVQIRCVLQNGKGPKGAWSQPTMFQSPAAAPVGLVDLWWYMDKGYTNLTVLWKALEPKAAKDHNVTYSVCYREGGLHGSSFRSIEVSCCKTILPRSVDYICISAANSVGRTQAANISLERSDFLLPERVTVKRTRIGLRVSWIPSRKQSQDVQEYVVQWSEASSSSAAMIRWKRLLPSNCSVLLTDDFLSQIPYLISVYGLYPHGYAGPATALAYFQEGVPSVGPDITVQNVSPSTVLVIWDEIPLEHQRGFITHYSIYTKRSAGSAQTLKSENVSVGRNSTLLHIHPATTYQLWVSASTSAGEGRKSYVEFTTQDAVLLPVILVPICIVVILLCVLGLCFHQRILDLGHWILPEWCWQSVPEPVHSKIATQAWWKDLDGFSGACGQSLDPVLTEVEESLSEEVPPSSSSEAQVPPVPPVAFSGYEKHFMPTAEDLEKKNIT